MSHLKVLLLLIVPYISKYKKGKERNEILSVET